MNRRAMIPVILVAMLATARWSAAQQPAGGSAPVAADPVAAWTPRLEVLDPRQPRGYFELGEEIASEAKDLGPRRLARQLYVLAYQTQKALGDNPGGGGAKADPLLGPSVCFALASIADNDEERRWLKAMAGAVGGEATAKLPQLGASASAREAAALDVANVMGLVRSGEGRKGTKLLEKPGVGELLDRYERLLSPGGLTGGAARIRKLAGEWPMCAECRNRRYIKGPEGVRLCPSCGGKPGPQLPGEEVMYQLRLESYLLHGVQRSWAAQTIADGGAPLRDLEPAELAATYQVDASKPLWRNGQWTAAQPAVSSPAPEKKP